MCEWIYRPRVDVGPRYLMCVADSPAIIARPWVFFDSRYAQNGRQNQIPRAHAYCWPSPRPQRVLLTQPTISEGTKQAQPTP